MTTSVSSPEEGSRTVPASALQSTPLSSPGAGDALPTPRRKDGALSEGALPAVEPPSSPSSPDFGVLYQNSKLYLVSRRHALWITVGGSVHMDGIFFLGNGITNDARSGATNSMYRVADLHNTFLARRIRLEVMGGAIGMLSMQSSLELGNNSPQQNTDPPQPSPTPQLQTAYVNLRIHPLFQLQVGQFNTPLMGENRVSSNLVDTPERALAVRAFGNQNSRDIGAMIWGAEPRRMLDYYVGVFGGDGPNRINRDNRFDVIARVAVRPFAASGIVSLTNLHFGLGAHWGTRGGSADYAFSNMTTPGGYIFFRNWYGAGANTVTLVPDGTQWTVSGDFEWTAERFGVKGEVVYVSRETREMLAGPSAASGALRGDAMTDAVRAGDLHGVGFYAQADCWPYGTPRTNGYIDQGERTSPPDLSANARVAPSPIPQGLQVGARVEGLTFTYDAGSRNQGAVSAIPSERSGVYSVWGFAVFGNYWIARHVRLTAHYEQYLMGAGTPGALASTDNHALGPRDTTEASVPTFGELTLRVAANF